MAVRNASRGGFADDTNESIGYLLRDASRRILSAMSDELETHGLSLPRYFVLRELYQKEGLTQREIANRVNVLEPTIVATLDALEAAGLVVRERSTIDRRKAHIMLTPAAHELRATLLGYAETVLERALLGLSPQAITALRSALQHIVSNFSG